MGVEIKELENEFLVLKETKKVKESDRTLCVQQRYGRIQPLRVRAHWGTPSTRGKYQENTSIADLDVETDKRGLNQGHRPSPISIFI